MTKGGKGGGAGRSAPAAGGRVPGGATSYDAAPPLHASADVWDSVNLRPRDAERILRETNWMGVERARLAVQARLDAARARGIHDQAASDQLRKFAGYQERLEQYPATRAAARAYRKSRGE